MTDILSFLMINKIRVVSNPETGNLCELMSKKVFTMKFHFTRKNILILTIK